MPRLPRPLLAIAPLLPLALALSCGTADAPAGAGGGTTATTTGTTTSSTTGIGGSSGSGGSACVPPAPQGMPIASAPDKLTWIPFDDAHCANGTPTGIGVSQVPGAKRLFIYLVGGGACWDKATCYDKPIAANIASGFGAADFAKAGVDAWWYFNRSAPDNPFAKDNLVVVPYCTGDVHGGTRVADYGGKPTAHVGALNMMAYLKRLTATFPDVEHVVLAGGSAGGIGASLHWARVKEAFPCARVDLIDDAAAILPPPYFHTDLQQTWRAAWGLDAALPADCAACKTELSAVYPYAAAKSPDGRGAVMAGLSDSVVAFFFQLTQAEVSQALQTLAKDTIAPVPNLRYYLVAGDHHGVFSPDFAQNGVHVPAWIEQMLSGDPAWTSVAPAACSAAATCQDCQTCALGGPCAAQAATCQANAECLALFQCAGPCNGNQDCVNACAAAHPDGVNDALAVVQCLNSGVCTGPCGP
ncbi:MAG: pectin acetylesterase-family hydrolase [Byssovorax sp.]